MDVSAQLVNLGPEAPVKLVGAVAAALKDPAEQNAFRTECSKLINEANAAELIRKLLGHRQVMLSFDKEETIEGCFAVLFHLLHRLPDPAKNMPVLVPEVTAALLDSEDKAGLRLRLATSLYNMLPAKTSVQFEVLLAIIKYAASTGLLAMLNSFFASMESMLAAWQLSLKDQRRLFLLVADVLSKASDAAGSQVFLMKYLVTFDNDAEGSKTSAKEVRAAAARGAVGAVKAPIVSFMEHHNLLGMSAVQELRNDPEYAQVYELLRIFGEEKLETYLAFAKANQALLEKHGISHDECVGNMRLLSLCSLGSEAQEVPYSVISETLQVDPEDVEEWVLQATQAGLMEARMDQLEKVVLISRCTCRVFGKEQWLSLQAKLGQWKANVSGLLQTIQRSNEVQAQRAQQLQQQQQAIAAPRRGSRQTYID
ncbi:hypothetical protein JKP88DRAFT_199832 [Tribonema minus]|uniref:Eukaryotic translation initiation factor 3 subunit M n=1 Tax=Tribonema minus TaxID=303371 RepID=A0A835Z3J7_9STRA|nr:hypothetical protein JKP88DRAFT_199832 [Tribonema minus]